MYGMCQELPEGRVVSNEAPSLYKHYKGKENILNALIDSAEARYDEMFGSENNIGRIAESQRIFELKKIKKREKHRGH